MRWTPIFIVAAGLFSGCAVATMQTEPCCATTCAPPSDPWAGWSPYDRELSAMAERDLTCPAAQLRYPVVVGLVGNLVEGCGEHAYYFMKCDLDGAAWDCHPMRGRDLN